MSDLNDVKAGKYQLAALSWEHITSKPGEPLDFVRYRRGDVVTLNVEDAKRLVAAGAVVKPGSLEKSAVEQAKAIAQQAQLAYEAALAGLPEDVRAEIAPDTVAVTPEPEKVKPPTIEELLDGVGTDKAKAKTALDDENAQEKPRTTYLAKLQAIIDAE